VSKTIRRILISVITVLFISCAEVLATEVKILFTGETHSALYPCDCPKEPDGGVARRASLIRDIRKKFPNSLLFETGGFFAGGIQDVYSQNVDLDKKRTQVYVRSIEIMGYDAVGIGDDEFNFGLDFLKEIIQKSNLRFVSANLKLENISPYIIKEVGGVRFGIIGATTLAARQKAGIAEIIEPFVAVKQYVAELKDKDVDFIILLSHLGEEEDSRLLSEAPGIDIVIISHSRLSNETHSRQGDSIIVRPSWQARRLGVLTLTIKDKKIVNFKMQELRLSEEIPDDPQILSVLPQCFQDSDCRQGFLTGTCTRRGTKEARCNFTKPLKVKLTVIKPKECVSCDTQETIERLKVFLSGLEVKYLDYGKKAAKKIISSLEIDALPVYLLDRDVTKVRKFSSLRPYLIDKKDFFLIKPSFAGIAYFVNRDKIEDRLDVFLSLYDKNAAGILDVVKQFNPRIHFLAVEPSPGKFDAPKGLMEVEEDLRAVCMMRFYPQKAYDYLQCRAVNIASSWWEDCVSSGVDTEKIRLCARSEEGKKMLRDNISLNKELKIMKGPAYLINNIEIVSSTGVPRASELKNLIEGRVKRR